MKTAIEMLNAIIEMQEANYGNGMNTHMELSTLVKQAKEGVKNCSIPDVVGQSEQLVAYNDQMKTAMQQHIEWLEGELQRCYDESRSASYINVFREKILLSSIEHAQSLLEKEKEQMKESFEEGICSKSSGSDFEYYYSVTYREKK